MRIPFSPRAGGVTYCALALAAVGMMLAAAPIGAAEKEKGCTAFLWSVAKEQAAFKQADLPTLDTGAAHGPWAAGTFFVLKLKPQAEVTLAVAPTGKEMDHDKAKKSFAGLVTFAAPTEAGVFHVTMSSHAWIEVIQDGKPLPAAAFSGARDCPDVGKSVRFEVGKAPVTVQISGAPVASMKVAIVPAVD